MSPSPSVSQTSTVKNTNEKVENFKNVLAKRRRYDFIKGKVINKNNKSLYRIIYG